MIRLRDKLCVALPEVGQQTDDVEYKYMKI